MFQDTRIRHRQGNRIVQCADIKTATKGTSISILISLFPDLGLVAVSQRERKIFLHKGQGRLSLLLRQNTTESREAATRMLARSKSRASACRLGANWLPWQPRAACARASIDASTADLLSSWVLSCSCRVQPLQAHRNCFTPLFRLFRVEVGPLFNQQSM